MEATNQLGLALARRKPKSAKALAGTEPQLNESVPCPEDIILHVTILRLCLCGSVVFACACIVLSCIVLCCIVAYGIVLSCMYVYIYIYVVYTCIDRGRYDRTCVVQVRYFF